MNFLGIGKKQVYFQKKILRCFYVSVKINKRSIIHISFEYEYVAYNNNFFTFIKFTNAT